MCCLSVSLLPLVGGSAGKGCAFTHLRHARRTQDPLVYCGESLLDVLVAFNGPIRRLYVRTLRDMQRSVLNPEAYAAMVYVTQVELEEQLRVELNFRRARGGSTLPSVAARNMVTKFSARYFELRRAASDEGVVAAQPIEIGFVEASKRIAKKGYQPLPRGQN